MNKQEARRINDEIRQILVKVWDPIGIKDEPRAQDEYDSYMGGVLHLLMNHRSEKEIEDYLWKIIEDSIHVHPQKEHSRSSTKGCY